MLRRGSLVVFVVSYLLIILLIGGGILWGYKKDINNEIRFIASAQESLLRQAETVIRVRLGYVKDDVRYLANQQLLQDWLQVRGESIPSPVLLESWSDFIQTHPIYDQLRLIGVSGRELIRVNRRKDQVEIVAEEDLQNKADRYYVTESLKIDQGEFYASPVDLNEERGEIEEPLNPTLRISTPVVDRTGAKVGFVIVNYRADVLLNRLKGLQQYRFGGQVWVLNLQGYWLAGPTEESEWGFALKGREEQQLQNQYPGIWKNIQQKQDVSPVFFSDSNGLYSVESVAIATNGPARWRLMAFLSEQEFDLAAADLQAHAWWIFALIAFLSLVLLMLAYYWQQRHAEARHQAAETQQRFEDLIQSAPDTILVAKPNGHILLANNQARKLFGYTGEELLALSVEDLMPERFRQAHHHHREGFATNPRSRMMMLGGELYIQTKTGKEIPVEISLSPLQTDDGLIITTIIRDVSERVQITEEKERLERRFKDIANNLPVGIFRKDTVGEARFLEINQAMVDIFEANSTAELLAHSVAEIHELVSDVELIRERIFTEGRIHHQAFKMKTLRGRDFWASISAVLRRDENGEPFIDGVIEDITETKQQEAEITQLNKSLEIHARKLENMNRELEAFSYSVSHDLRAPLRAIDGFSRTLLKDYSEVLDDRGVDRLQRVRRAAQRMAQLIDDMLMLSRVTRTDLVRKKVNITELISDILQGMQASESDRSVAIELENPMISDADPGLVRILLENLLGNAWKFSSKKEHTVISAGIRQYNGKAYFYIRDNGAGFDQTYQNKLFTAFQRLHDQAEFQGTGIGLATVNRIVQMHGGDIWAEGAVGEGATFYFTLSPEMEDLENEQ